MQYLHAIGVATQAFLKASLLLHAAWICSSCSLCLLAQAYQVLLYAYGQGHSQQLSSSCNRTTESMVPGQLVAESELRP